MNISAKFDENRTSSCFSINDNDRNEQTSKQTNKLTWSQYLLVEVINMHTRIQLNKRVSPGLAVYLAMFQYLIVLDI